MRSAMLFLALLTACIATAHSEVQPANMIQISVNTGSSAPDPNRPVLNLFSFTNCTNAVGGSSGDRLSGYIGNAYTPAFCDGPVTYTYDTSRPGKSDQVYMRTTVQVQTDGTYLADFYMFYDAACLDPYQFMPTFGASAYRVQQTENSCQVYTNDFNNPVVVVSASVFFGAASHTATTLPAAAIALILTIGALLQTNIC